MDIEMTIDWTWVEDEIAMKKDRAGVEMIQEGIETRRRWSWDGCGAEGIAVKILGSAFKKYIDRVIGILS